MMMMRATPSLPQASARPLLGAMLLALTGCPDPSSPLDPIDGSSTGLPAPTTGEVCEVGALGCACTAGGGCDPGLVCIDQQCEPAPTATTDDGDPDGGSTDSTGPGLADSTSGGETTSSTGDQTTGTGDTGELPPAVMSGTHTVPIGYFDVALDDERHQVFLSYGASGEVLVVDLLDGTQTTVITGHRAEALHFDPTQDAVVVALPIADHSPYWWDDDQEGYAASIDALTLQDPAPVWFPLDPWDIVSDGTDMVYVASGSGQWTTAGAIDLATGWFDIVSSVRQRTRIRIHPMLDRIYGANTDLIPSDIERWNLTGGTVQPSYDSPYHGDYPMCGDLRIHPSGDTIYTRCGHVFLATNVQPSDMTWTGDLGVTWIDLDFHPSGDTAYALVSASAMIHAYDTASLMPAGDHPLITPASRLLAGPSYIVVFRDVMGGMPHVEVEVILYDEL